MAIGTAPGTYATLYGATGRKADLAPRHYRVSTSGDMPRNAPSAASSRRLVVMGRCASDRPPDEHHHPRIIDSLARATSMSGRPGFAACRTLRPFSTAISHTLWSAGTDADPLHVASTPRGKSRHPRRYASRGTASSRCARGTRSGRCRIPPPATCPRRTCSRAPARWRPASNTAARCYPCPPRPTRGRATGSDPAPPCRNSGRTVAPALHSQ